MKSLTLLQVRRAVAGKSIAPIVDQGPTVHAVCTNSRQMQPSSLFIALRGERFDGHDFLPDAAAGGAVAAIVDAVPANAPENLHYIVVPDTRLAMGKLAKVVRQQMRGKVIAVAGSNGKTSTKYLIDACLRGRLRGSMSPKSFNNDIGVPLTIFPADPNQDYLVLELGTNHPGEIRTLTTMASPDIAVITNCSAEHLEFLGDLMGVRRENASLIQGLNPKGVLIVNGDDPELLAAVAGYSGKKITFGFAPTNDLFAANVECDATGTRFSMNGRATRAFVPMLGRHTASNALAAIAVGRKMGLTEAEILENLSHATGPEMRLQLQNISGIQILNDAYNANPASMKAALETLAALPTTGRRIAIVGDMRELGDSSERCHREVGEFLTGPARPDVLICVGPYSAMIAQAVQNHSPPPPEYGSIHHFPDAASAAAVVAAWPRPGDLVLLKASRGIHLETVARAIFDSCAARQKIAS